MGGRGCVRGSIGEYVGICVLDCMLIGGLEGVSGRALECKSVIDHYLVMPDKASDSATGDTSPPLLISSLPLPSLLCGWLLLLLLFLLLLVHPA